MPSIERKTRYLPRHKWYLADALRLVQRLQAVAWPLGWHIALGGGVLNHGYSDKDLDLYVLPIYREGVKDELAVLTALVGALMPGELPAPNYEDMIPESFQGRDHECFKYSVRISAMDGVGQIELFVVRRAGAQPAVAAPSDEREGF